MVKTSAGKLILTTLLVSVLVSLCTSLIPLAPPVSADVACWYIDLSDLAPQATWTDGNRRVSYGDDPDGERPYVMYHESLMEDGRTWPALETRPSRQGTPYIRGKYNITVPLGPYGAYFTSSVGFLNDAPRGRTVTFKVSWRRAGSNDIFQNLVSVSKSYDGYPKWIQVDMSNLCGTPVELMLEVESGGLGTQDMVAWLCPMLHCINEPDSPFRSCFVDSGNWYLQGSDLLDIAAQTVGTKESCNVPDGGKPYYQMVLGCNGWWEALMMGYIDDKPRRQWWCSETVAYWHHKARIPYPEGYRTDYYQNWQLPNAQAIATWYQTEEERGGRGRWIDSTELDYSNFQPGVNAPCPGAYQAWVKYYEDPPGSGNWRWDWSDVHSQVIDEMWVHRKSDGTVVRVDIRLIEGNSGDQVTNTGRVENIIDFTPLGDRWGGDRKIAGWGIDIVNGAPYCRTDRIHYVTVSEGPPPRIRAGQRDMFPTASDSNRALVQRLVDYSRSNSGKKPGLQFSGAMVRKTVFDTERPDERLIAAQAVARKDLDIRIDLNKPHPLPIKGARLEFRLPEGTSPPKMMTYAGRGLFGTALFPSFVPMSGDVPHRDVRFIRFVIPKGGLTEDTYIERFVIDYDWGPDGDAPNWQPQQLLYEGAMEQSTTGVQCPTGCTCMAVEEAKKLGYDFCQKQLTECGKDASGNILYCFGQPAATPVPPQCPAGCVCMNKVEAEKLGYTLCNGQIIECGNDAGGIPMYCYQKAAMPETKHVPGKLIIEPAQGRNPVGSQHTFTFTLYDTNGKPLPYVRIYISHTGANTLAPIELVTDANGRTSYSYTGRNAGTDYIMAKVDNVVAQATKEWYAQPVETTVNLPGRIVISPPSDKNPVGTTHTLTITVYSTAGKPMVNSRVRITHSGANVYLPAELTTDANGTVKYSYTGNKAGLDTITVSVGTISATATKEWYTQAAPVTPARLTLTPTNASNPPGKTHTVTATVIGSDGKPMSGVDVTFSVTGVNNFARHATTDASGRASISYTSKKEGKDTINATAGGLKATATKWWEVIR